MASVTPNSGTSADGGLTFGQAYGEARDNQAVPKAVRTEIEAALKQSKLPVSEQNIRLLYRAYVEAKRREGGSKESGERLRK